LTAIHTLLIHWLLLVSSVVAPLCAVAADRHDDVRRAVANDNDRAVVLADTEGSIGEITLHYDPLLRDALDPAYRDLFSALPTDVRLEVLCPSSEAAEEFSQSWGMDLAEHEVHVVDVGLDISAWARDRYIARRMLREQVRAPGFVPASYGTYRQDQSNDLFIQWILHDAGLAPYPATSWLRIEGGNVVSNNRHVFVGASLLTENDLAPLSLLFAELHHVVGRDYILVSDHLEAVPWEHVDMFLTPVDDSTVLLASQVFAIRLLARSGDECIGSDGTCCDPPVYVSDTAVVQEQLDEIADSLGKEGYRVFRLPAIISDRNNWAINYNNVVMETRQGQRIVYMPVYGIPVLDRVAEAVYCMEGFEVKTIDVSKLYVHGGAVRCIVNVTERRLPSPAVHSLAHHTAPPEGVLSAHMFNE